MNDVRRFGQENNKPPFFSIIIVSYNYAKTLPRTLEAIRDQSFSDYEIVIVDNGSTDDTDTVINRFINDNSSLRVKHIRIKENKGLPKGRNAGIENSEGIYLIFNDADDWMDKECLAVMHRASENGTKDRIAVQLRDVDPEGKELQIRNYTDDMSKWVVTLFQGSAFKREYFTEYNIRVPEVFNDDYYTSLYFSAVSDSFVPVQETLYNFLINKNSTSGVNTISDRTRILSLFEEAIHIIEEIKSKVHIDNDLIMMDYQLIKSYYSILLNYNRNVSFEDLYTTYKELHKLFIGYNPTYLNNRNLKLFSKNGDRFYGRLITFTLTRAEKMKCMKLLLWIYNIMSKRKFFNV